MNKSNWKDRISDQYKNPSYIGDYKLNLYRCNACASTITTVDVDDGVTPFTINCKKCKEGRMFSACYPRIEDAPTDGTVKTQDEILAIATYEWYRPDKLSKNQYIREHALNGGLDLRKRTSAKPVCHKI